MRLIKPSFEIIEQQPGILGLYKQIELAGRTCYKSEDKITPDSAAAFVDRMIKSGHGAMLEHGTVYLYSPMQDVDTDDDGYVIYESKLDRYKYNKYSKFNGGYVTTNLRVLVENGWTDDLKYICEPTKYHEKRITVRFICDRGVSHEFVRHRVFSFAQESTRYCNYSKVKFGNEITCIIPCWMNLEEGSYNDGKFYNPIATPYLVKGTAEERFLLKLVGDELDYFELLEKGWKPQQARAILPNSLKTELVMTGFTSDWKHFFKLRDAGSAHPQAQELAKPLHEEFIRRNYVNE